ncbi:flagellar protein FlaG [Sporomusa malonica]|uniref:Flagellar protein FlaG n=1 Tax=Sporomusa malonica TaxID=112901 RepID=A0A1W2EJB0_9FIRM|nr:flagellar protein FlaG [Sporomusa malonica]SMD09797.1 flagellar protein FlaG [Sporomusa malonica]
MSITNVNSNASRISSTAVAATKPANIQDVIITNESNSRVVQDADNKQYPGTTADKNQFSKSELENVTEKLNNFMQSINTDIRFELHTETNTLMIQVEDSKTHEVLKEVPAHELLDMVTRIRECIGVFLDKKA